MKFICPSCGTINSEEASHCPACGQAMTADPAALRTQVQRLLGGDTRSGVPAASQPGPTAVPPSDPPTGEGAPEKTPVSPDAGESQKKRPRRRRIALFALLAVLAAGVILGLALLTIPGDNASPEALVKAAVEAYNDRDPVRLNALLSPENRSDDPAAEDPFGVKGSQATIDVSVVDVLIGTHDRVAIILASRDEEAETPFSSVQLTAYKSDGKWYFAHYSLMQLLNVSYVTYGQTTDYSDLIEE